MSDVAIVSAGIAGGHHGVAHELARRLECRGLSATVHDLVELLPAGLGRLLRDLYRAQLTAAPRSWAWLYEAFDTPGRPRLADLTTSLARRALLSAIGPDVRVVVSTYPLAGRAIGLLRRDGLLRVPAIAYLTDMAVHRLWVAEGVDAHLTMHAEPARQARALGARHVLVAAPAVRPAFHDVASAGRRRQARAQLGLPADEPLALVVGGSWGVGEIEDTMADVAVAGRAVPVAVCGNNPPLLERLRRHGVGIALGWTDDVPDLLGASDVVIQNAGGLTSLEALAAGVPVLSYRCVAGHGLANSRALARAGLAPLANDRAELAVELRRALGEDGEDAVVARTELFAAPDPAEVIAGWAEPVHPAGARRAEVPR